MEERTRVFVDSNVFIALANESDSLHKRALSTLTALERENFDILINNLIFAEIVTIISMRLGRQEGIQWGKTILDNPKIKIAHIDSDIHYYTWQIFQKINKKNISFTDCSILTILQTENIKHLLTFDHTDFQSLQKQFRFKMISQWAH